MPITKCRKCHHFGFKIAYLKQQKIFSNSTSHHHRHDPWAESPLVSNSNFIILFPQFSFSGRYSQAVGLQIFLHYSFLSSIRSLIGLPHLPFPSMIPNITLLFFCCSQFCKYVKIDPVFFSLLFV